MKKTFFLIVSCILFFACNNDDDASVNPLDQLPPATQTGANTAGCLVDGEVLVPKGNTLIFQCYYQLVEGEYYFSISFRDKSEQLHKSINVFSRKSEINQGGVYTLNITDEIDEEGYGAEYNLGTNMDYSYDTNETVIGELTITKLDLENNVISGLFWFDAINGSGEIREIREGRFDAQFTE